MASLPRTKVADLPGLPDGAYAVVSGMVTAFPAQLVKDPLFPVRYARLSDGGASVTCRLGENAFYLYASTVRTGDRVVWFGFVAGRQFIVTAHNHRLVPLERGPDCAACLELALGGSYYEWRELHRRIKSSGCHDWIRHLDTAEVS